MLSALVSIAISLGIMEAAKLLDRAVVKPADAQNIANQVLQRAEKVGSAKLNEALNIINNIPMISGSPTVKKYLTEARQRADQNYKNVEKEVVDMKTGAQNTANLITDEGSKSVLSKIGDSLSGNSTANRINAMKDQAFVNIEKSVGDIK